MKPILIILLLVCLHTIALSQEFTAIIGRNPTCNRSGGICTLQSADTSNKSESENNVSIFQTKNGATILRVYKERLTKQEADRILGTPITIANRNSLQFVMEAPCELPEEMVTKTSALKSRQIQTLEAKTYPTVIKDTYIDITIVVKER